jgi:hypothetical protein
MNQYDKAHIDHVMKELDESLKREETLESQLADSQRVRATLLACIENLKCCGSCRWFEPFEGWHGVVGYICNHETAGGGTHSPRDICPAWELQEDWRGNAVD